ncbi:hypothetical protein MSPP1_004149 [Malassezia sp. CBS 17886]|nr:hypothetical protein MSPP1_004149 [Malassezia sp. CBS 17886]
MTSMSQDKWVGLVLAVSSSAAIGTSFIITKKGLMSAAEDSAGLASDRLSYLRNPIWWAGMSTMVVGEVANFIAYTFAPPILVTPLGALSVLIGAVLASFILHERLGPLGQVGCALCLIGTVVIIVNAPEDRDIQTVDEILAYAMHTPFLLYCLFVAVFSTVVMWRVAPVYGRRSPLVYLSVCSLVGSISVMSVKAFGVALKLTFNGNNQLTRPSTYVFALVVVMCIMVQMNYFNKALDQFSTNVVNPMYYVMFTSSTIFASVLLFQGFNTTGAEAVSLLGGFAVTFIGVHLLNVNRHPDGPSTPRRSFTARHGERGRSFSGLPRAPSEERLRDGFELTGNVPPQSESGRAHARGPPQHGPRASTSSGAHAVPAATARAAVPPFETWVMAPLVWLAVVYDVASLIPARWLPSRVAAHCGYRSDLFLTLGAKTTVSTRVLREAFAPSGALARLGVAEAWHALFGEDAVNTLLARLSSVEGRKLYLVVGEWPFLACAFCMSERDYAAFAVAALVPVYLCHAFVLAALTMPPRGVLPQLVNRALGDDKAALPLPVRTRQDLRAAAFGLLIGMLAVDTAVVLYAGDALLVHGRWEHWHANMHLVRHALFLVLVTYVYVRVQMQRPAVLAMEALRAVANIARHTSP